LGQLQTLAGEFSFHAQKGALGIACNLHEAIAAWTGIGA
jgi:hypothetical protein